MREPRTRDGKPTHRRYANHFEIGCNEAEYIIDFGQKYSRENAQIHTRIVMTPFHAKVLAELLSESVRQYEERIASLK